MEQKNHENEELTYPARINKYLAHKNVTTRRGADALIEAGKISINGNIAKLGDRVNEGDVVEVIKQAGTGDRVYLAYNKPAGIVTTMPQPGEESIVDIFPFRTKIFPVGRLDKESHGLLILTNDGRITKRLLEPQYDHDKEYIVEVNKQFPDSFLKKLSKGVELEDFTTKPCETRRIDETHFSITLTEGKRHQIRRMVTKYGYEVFDLRRVRIMNIKLGNISENSARELKGEELATFLKSLGL